MSGMDNLGDIVYEAVYRAAIKMGISQALANDLALMSDEDVRRERGGERVYVPAPSKEIRDMRIVNAKINGESVQSIARREGLSVSGVYKICADLGF